MKKTLAILTLLALLLCGAAQAEEARRVYLKGEVPEFAQEEILLELFVAPTVGCDGMLMVSGDQAMVIDTCTEGQYEKLQRVIAGQDITHINYAFNTHPDYDHLGGIFKLIEDFQVDTMVTAFPEKYVDFPSLQGRAVKAMKAAGIPITTVADGDVIDFGNATLTVLRQTKIATSSNQLSAMLMVKVGDCRMLLTGDAENRAQQVFVRQGYDLKADIMKYPHHGTSRIDTDFIAAVAPEAVFITHSFSDSEASHASLAKYGVPYGVSSLGVIHIMTNGEYWIIEHHVSDEQLFLLEKFGLAF